VPETNTAPVAKPRVRASILVLDDDDGFRRFLVTALTDAGYSVAGTGNANEAITLLSSVASFDLLVADVKMPIFQPHGIAVGNIARLRQRRIKIIYVSGDPGHVPNGFIDVAETPLLGKPINLKTLLSTVEGVLAPRDK
jgi:two-component system cell cycle response regulator CpdR